MDEKYLCDVCEGEYTEDEMYCTGYEHDPICNDCWEAEMKDRHDKGITVVYVGARRYETRR